MNNEKMKRWNILPLPLKVVNKNVQKKKGAKEMRTEWKNLSDDEKMEIMFSDLINAMDDFLDIEESEIGCLTEEEHERMIDDRNYYSDLFLQKTKKETMSTSPKVESLSYLSDWDDCTEIDSFTLKKRQREMELGM